MLIGTNDLGSEEPWAIALAETQLLLQQLHRARPRSRILVHGLFPRGGDEGAPGTSTAHRSFWWEAHWNRHVTAITSFNAGLAAHARERPWLRYAECSTPFIAHADDPEEQQQPPRNRRGRFAYIRPELMYDLLHLTPRGYRAWANCLQPHVAAAVSETGTD